jgi:hypothetical protein
VGHAIPPRADDDHGAVWADAIAPDNTMTWLLLDKKGDFDGIQVTAAMISASVGK